MYPTIQPDELTKAYADEIMHMVGDSLGETALVAALSHHHRTLQQNLTRVMVEWITYLADLEPGEFDPRNEASVKLAKNIVAMPGWDRLKYLPYI